MRIIVILLLVMCSHYSMAQFFQVRSFVQSLSDGSAFNAPMDDNGLHCGLVKIRTSIENLSFEGSIVGEVENNINEYWVYVPKGCQKIVVKHANYLPVEIDFKNFGIDILPKTTYIMTLKDMQTRKEKCSLTITTKPDNAKLFINNVFIEDAGQDGYYLMYLPKGEYVCRIEQSGYRSTSQVVTIGKGAQNLNVELESIMAELDFRSKTLAADLYINGEKKGNGAWKGELCPGDYLLEAKMDNYETQTQSIRLEEKEKRTITLPELKRLYGKLRITTSPDNLLVTIDGEEVGKSPCELVVETGTHVVACDAYGCLPKQVEVDITNTLQKKLNLSLEFSSDDEYIKDQYKKAYSGDTTAIKELAEGAALYHNKYPDFESMGEYAKEAVFWSERYPNVEKLIAENLESPVSYFDLISCYLCLNKVDRVLEFADIIGDGIYDKMASYYEYTKEDYQKAIFFLEKKKLDGYDYCELGRLYKNIGNSEKAIIYYQKYLNFIKDDTSYRDVIREIEKELYELRQK